MRGSLIPSLLLSDRRLAHRSRSGCPAPGQQPRLAGLDLERERPGVDAALGQAAGDEPQTRLRSAGEHVEQFLVVAESPDGAEADGDRLAEELADQVLLPLVAGGQYDQIRG